MNKFIFKFLIFVNLFLVLVVPNSNAQDDSTRVRKVDSTYIYKPSSTLKPYDPDDKRLSGAQGFEIAFSNSGLGLGYFLHKFLDNDNIVFFSFYISGARNSDEYEYYNYSTGKYEIPGKVNRLYLIPFTVGYTRILFSNSISGSFRPFASIGAGPSLVLSTPYDKDWFEAWKYHTSYLRFGAFAEIGAYFRSIGNSVSSIGLKYYVIPFGGTGLESIKDSPIKDFGGIVLSMNVGFGF